MEIDPDEADARTLYRTMTTIVVPRPIGWISSADADGRENLAPFSHFNTVSTAPPVVYFSAGTEEGRKDTARNILSTEEFVVNLVTRDLLKSMDLTSAKLDPNKSEFKFAKLETETSEIVRAPRVYSSPVTFECELYDYVDVFGTDVIFGKVLRISIDDALLTAGKIDMNKIDPVGRLGGPYYTDTERLGFERQY